jgi:hypothetical protein
MSQELRPVFLSCSSDARDARTGLIHVIGQGVNLCAEEKSILIRSRVHIRASMAASWYQTNLKSYQDLNDADWLIPNPMERDAGADSKGGAAPSWATNCAKTHTCRA